MERQEFLKRAGIGAIGFASLPFLADTALAGDDDGSGRRLYFVSASGTGAALTAGETVIMSGCGRFSDSELHGRGEFVHFDGRKIPSPNFLGTGRWEATRFISFREVGTFGAIVAGILTAEIELSPCGGDEIGGVTLQVVCNIGPAAIFTGLQEGFTLTLPGPVVFAPFTPNVGLTAFTRRCREDEGEDD